MRNYNDPQEPKHYQSYSSPVSTHYPVINESPGEAPLCVTNEIPLTTEVINLFNVLRFVTSLELLVELFKQGMFLEETKST